MGRKASDLQFLTAGLGYARREWEGGIQDVGRRPNQTRFVRMPPRQLAMADSDQPLKCAVLPFKGNSCQCSHRTVLDLSFTWRLSEAVSGNAEMTQASEERVRFFLLEMKQNFI